MPAPALPEGRYLSLAFRVAPDAGGQTRALLLRSRLLAAAGADLRIVSLGAAPDVEEQRRRLIEQGLLDERIPLLNLYEHAREHGWGEDAAPTGRGLPDLAAHRIGEEARADGSPWRITYRVPGERHATYDYLRADGTPYLRIPAFGLAHGGHGVGTLLQVAPDGEIVGELPSAGHWFRAWIRALHAGAKRTFVFIDSRFVVPHVVPLRTRRIHLVYQMHNLHLTPPYRWDSPAPAPYKRVLSRIAGLSALVTLTERQRDDIAARKGRTANLFVVPNPVLPADPPAEAVARDPRRVVAVARLERQKRLGHAIAAFEQVVAAVPEARLDIYGDGSRRDELQAEIDRRGLGDRVTLRGFDPRARDALWAASAFLLTSVFEGYPLSTLESMSRGCPVVGYDIKYGPREQITDGVDGFLVAPGDVDALAGRVIELLRDPALVERMGAAARTAAGRFGPDESVARWAEVLRGVVGLASRRTRFEEVAFAPARLRLVRRGGLQLDGTLRVRASTRRKAALTRAVVTLDAVDDETGAITQIPLRVEPAEDVLRVRTPGGLLGGPRVPEGARLRLRLVWENSAWEAELAPGEGVVDPEGRAAAPAPLERHKRAA